MDLVLADEPVAQVVAVLVEPGYIVGHSLEYLSNRALRRRNGVCIEELPNLFAFLRGSEDGRDTDEAHDCKPALTVTPVQFVPVVFQELPGEFSTMRIGRSGHHDADRVLAANVIFVQRPVKRLLNEVGVREACQRPQEAQLLFVQGRALFHAPHRVVEVPVAALGGHSESGDTEVGWQVGRVLDVGVEPAPRLRQRFVILEMSKLCQGRGAQ